MHMNRMNDGSRAWHTEGCACNCVETETGLDIDRLANDIASRSYAECKKQHEFDLKNGMIKLVNKELQDTKTIEMQEKQRFNKLKQLVKFTIGTKENFMQTLAEKGLNPRDILRNARSIDIKNAWGNRNKEIRAVHRKARKAIHKHPKSVQYLRPRANDADPALPRSFRRSSFAEYFAGPSACILICP